MPPEVRATDQYPKDGLVAPLAADLQAELRRPEGTPDRGDVARARQTTARRQARPPRRRFGVRRVRRVVRHVEPLSVLKLSLFFYAVFLVIWLIFVTVAYTMLSNMGLFEAIESIREGFALGGQFEVSFGTVAWWAFIVGVGLGLVGSLVNVFLAIVYNLAADLIGGLEVTFVEREL